ncbi:hypothetical protein D3C87_2003820 [compost metagenome]
MDEACVTQNTGATVKFFVFTENPSGPTPPASSKISIDLKSIGLPDNYVITDLWSGKVVGQFSGEFAPVINQHGAGLYKIVKVSK